MAALSITARLTTQEGVQLSLAGQHGDVGHGWRSQSLFVKPVSLLGLQQYPGEWLNLLPTRAPWPSLKSCSLASWPQPLSVLLQIQAHLPSLKVTKGCVSLMATEKRKAGCTAQEGLLRKPRGWEFPTEGLLPILGLPCKGYR